MKRKIVILLVGVMLMNVSGCGSNKSEREDNITNTENVIAAESSQTEENNNIEEGGQTEKNNNVKENSRTEENSKIKETNQSGENNSEEKNDDSPVQDAEGTFSFAEFKNLQFVFSSGAGAWGRK